MKNRIIVVLVFATVMLFAGNQLFAAGAGDKLKYNEWLKNSQLGQYQPKTEDWDAIYRAALNEPTLVIYSATSRITRSIKQMLVKYPGLKINTINIGSVEANERVRREWGAGLRQVGIHHVGLPDYHNDVLIPAGALTNYVPRELQKIMDPLETTPMLRHRYHGGVWIYGTTSGNPKTAPWKNIWELTTPKWRGKVGIWDPMQTDLSLEYFAALIHHSDEMAAFYKDLFGKPLKLTTPNAGLEFMKCLMDNGLRIFPDHRDVDEAVSKGGGNFVGLTTSSSYRLVIDGTYKFEIDTNSPSLRGYNTLLIGSFTPSPNTAKMVVRWLMSKEGGAEWWGPNFPPASLKIPVPPPWRSLHDFKYMWEVPAKDGQKLTSMVVDHWMIWR